MAIWILLICVAMAVATLANARKEDPELKELKSILNSRNIEHAMVRGRMGTPQGEVEAILLIFKDPRTIEITVERQLTKAGNNLVLIRIPAGKIDKEIKQFLRVMK